MQKLHWLLLTEIGSTSSCRPPAASWSAPLPFGPLSAREYSCLPLVWGASPVWAGCLPSGSLAGQMCLEAGHSSPHLICWSSETLSSRQHWSASLQAMWMRLSADHYCLAILLTDVQIQVAVWVASTSMYSCHSYISSSLFIDQSCIVLVSSTSAFVSGCSGIHILQSLQGLPFDIHTSNNSVSRLRKATAGKRGERKAPVTLPVSIFTGCAITFCIVDFLS